MMAPTHAIAGAVLALPVLAGSPDLAIVAGLAGLLGGLVPDLDLYTGHRRRLHYPVYGGLFAVPAIGIALLVPTAVTVGTAAFLGATTLHAASDILGGGLELRPWAGTSDRAVYDHFHDRWRAPLRVIRYDGAPEDLLLAVGLGAVVLAGFGLWSPVGLVTIALLAIATVYVLLRKPLATLAGWLFPRLPPTFHPYVPDRYFEATGSQ